MKDAPWESTARRQISRPFPKVYARLPKTCPYIGVFHYSPGAGNRGRKTFFEKDILSVEQLNRQHAIKCNPNIGNFHYGDDVYGDRLTQFRRQLRSWGPVRGVERKQKSKQSSRPLGERRSTFAQVMAPGLRKRGSFDEEDEIIVRRRAHSCMGAVGAPPVATSPPRMARMDEGSPTDPEHQEQSYQSIRRALRRAAYATVIYGSGDNLHKMQEKEFRELRRRNIPNPFYKYDGAIDSSKKYPKTGTLDDCAMLRPMGAQRSKLFNDLIAEVNGFRRHFVLQQKMHPKEAYRQSFLRGGQGGDIGSPRARHNSMSLVTSITGGDEAGGYHPDDVAIREELSPLEEHYESNFSSVSQPSKSPIPRKSSLGSQPFFPNGKPQPASIRRIGTMGSVNGEGARGGQQAGISAPPRSHTHSPGDSWIPGTVSAAVRKSKWKSAQSMRDCRKFQPFYVQAKTDLKETYDVADDVVLGQGSYASVYSGNHRASGEQVAVKAIQKSLLFSDTEKSSVMSELENQLRIVHPHVVRLYEIYETPVFLYMVLEHCPCGDLEQLMYIRGRLKDIEAARVTKQVLMALEHLHNNGIVHCDIKPQNLLFAPDKEDDAPSSANSKGCAVSEVTTSPSSLLCKLCDFGLSRKVPDTKFYKFTGDVNKIPFSALVGTGGYIAPEIMRHESFGKAADLWSVGVMLYQMLSGRMPFVPARACLASPVGFPPAAWRDVDPKCKDLIQKLLDKDPATRLTAEQVLPCNLTGPPLMDSPYSIAFRHTTLLLFIAAAGGGGFL
ncbi:unnamed protein product [Chrysoparadoxa australica]